MEFVMARLSWVEEVVGVDIGHKDAKKVVDDGKVELEEGKVNVGPSYGQKEMNNDKRSCWGASSFVIVVRWSIDAGQKILDIVGGIIVFFLDGCLGFHAVCCWHSPCQGDNQPPCG